MQIDAIDSNFRAGICAGKDVVYFQLPQDSRFPARVEGFPFRGEYKNGELRRLPASWSTREINEGALELANHTSGGRIRLRSDSRWIAIRATLRCSCDMNHMPRLGSAGFDCYADGVFFASFQPDAKVVNQAPHHFEGVSRVSFADKKMRDWTVNLPLYGGVETIEIGLEPDCVLESPRPHKVERPVIFYGSSITQGGCASRPGNSYPAILARTLDFEEINWGFSGSARGELAMAEAVAKLNASLFVMDYDHNAPDVEYLRKTHEPFFRTVREQNPELPILLLSRCDFHKFDPCAERRSVIEETYRHTLASGDKRTNYIDGETLFEGESDCTVDGCHPNDLGFRHMANRILPVMRAMLEK
ncbi:MAG: SGNH/GDSL hydrolase family protein [Victivallaceae bacterium]|nr:SGNH/GDSL hydrolase family protein [Victivallaceae bacterium]